MRRDYHHKQALASARENQVIHVEDLDIVGMVATAGSLAPSVMAGWGQFVRIISEKADRYERTVHTVSRSLASSKPARRADAGSTNSRYESVNSRARLVGRHDRDHNAAKIILAAGRTERLSLPRQWAEPRQ